MRDVELLFLSLLIDLGKFILILLSKSFDLVKEQAFIVLLRHNFLSLALIFGLFFVDQVSWHLLVGHTYCHIQSTVFWIT